MSVTGTGDSANECCKYCGRYLDNENFSKELTLARPQSLQACLGSKSVLATLHYQCQTGIDALLTLFL